MRRVLLLAAGVAGAAVLAAPVLAAQSWGQGGLLHYVARHNHHHKHARELLGERRHQDGRHEIDRIKGRHVHAEVKGGKVVNMDAEDLKLKRVKSDRKMADLQGGVLAANATARLQLVQDAGVQYGYCFDDGVDYTCYWYEPEDVDYQDYSWEPYDPNY